ncbi:substrate-binding domain-containing protein [Dictyobacter aurantiacus]|uniref:HTH gntR-type domain-containing protein n=1 Tax=Dictyobacter aurantiacus TaxID=1936993 RepID=A0A401ZNA8_9CHLR|nr:GntR family transcriptional regulator [Dictyobacter aurantiacus]GCE08323.1 hypothetical protein KDAU_56520 [Dictyobacter aurantiacus]
MSTAHGQEPQLPLYRRIAQSIRQDIAQRGLAAHTKIASEVELARQFGVSQGTITKSLEALVREGVLYRRRPQGTFVADIEPPRAEIAPASTGIEEKRVELSSPTFHMPGRTAFVGIVIPHFGTDFLDGIVLGVESMTRSFGYGLSFAYSEDDEGLERYHIEQFLRQDVAGMIIYPCDHRVLERDGGYVSTPEGKDRIALLQTLQARQIPFVLLDRYVPEIEASYVVSDDFMAGYASTQHLIKLGHRRVGFVSVNYLVTSSAARRAGYLQCMRDHQLPVDEHLLLDTLWHAYPSAHDHGAVIEVCCPEDGQRLLAYLQHPRRPTAVVTMNDYLAVQVLCSLEQTSLRMPEDLALVCGGGSSRLSSMMRVPLTTIVQPVGELGRQSAHLLHNRISQRFSTNRHLKLPVSLLVRKSCGSTANAVVQTLPMTAER